MAKSLLSPAGHLTVHNDSAMQMLGEKMFNSELDVS